MDSMTALQACPALRGFSQEQLDKLNEEVLVRGYSRDESIFRQGEDAFGLCFVLEGTVALQEQVAGRLVELATLSPGDLVGWSGLVRPHKFTGTAVALTKTKIAIVGMVDLRQMFEQDPRAGYIFERNLAEMIAKRFHDMQSRLSRNLVDF